MMKKIILRSRQVKKIFHNIVIQNLYGQSSVPTLKTCNWRSNENLIEGIKEFIKLLISKFVGLNIYFFIIYFRKYIFFKK